MIVKLLPFGLCLKWEAESVDARSQVNLGARDDALRLLVLEKLIRSIIRFELILNQKNHRLEKIIGRGSGLH